MGTAPGSRLARRSRLRAPRSAAVALRRGRIPVRRGPGRARLSLVDAGRGERGPVDGGEPARRAGARGGARRDTLVECGRRHGRSRVRARGRGRGGRRGAGSRRRRPASAGPGCWRGSSRASSRSIWSPGTSRTWCSPRRSWPRRPVSAGATEGVVGRRRCSSRGAGSPIHRSWCTRSWCCWARPRSPGGWAPATRPGTSLCRPRPAASSRARACSPRSPAPGPSTPRPRRTGTFGGRGSTRELIEAYRERFRLRAARYVQWISVPLAIAGTTTAEGFLQRFLTSWLVVMAIGIPVGY